ncbi:MAG: HDOD domain-containing protein, partial [Rhodoferax sp.]|nr:HDOD domain-containing protein [Rhodoferax sp.]
MLSRANLPQEVAKLAKNLPPFPAIVVQLLDMLRDESASFETLAHMARNDAIISANILAHANHLRRIHAQSDLADAFVAASIIGINRVRRIVVTTGMNRFVASVPGGPFLFQHSMAVAIAAQELAVYSGASQDLAYIAGMLHDVGQLCLHMLDERAFEKVYMDSIVDGKLVQREAQVFGVDHCEVGAQLARYWNLPGEIYSAILNHHDEETVTCPLQAGICLSETLARALDLPSSPKNRVTLINHHAVAELGVDW